MAANGISTLEFKRARQNAKLALAADKRAISGRRSNLDISQLTTVYSPTDNTIINNPNLNGLIVGRPWTNQTPLQSLITSMFGSNEQGAIYVPMPVVNGVQSLFQGAAGTTPVTADGDPVGRMLDQSGNGYHAIQSVSGSRPVYRTDGVLHWFEGDGIDDWLSAGDVEGLDSISSLTIALGLNTPTGSLQQSPIAKWAASGSGPFGMLIDFIQTNARFFFGTASPTSGSVLRDGSPAVFYYQAGSGESKIFKNAQLIGTGSVASVTPNTNEPLSIGAKTDFGSPSAFFDGPIYAIVVATKVLSNSDRDNLNAYVAAQSGVTL